MKKLALSLGIFLLVGAGCASGSPTPTPTSTGGGAVTPTSTIPTPTSTATSTKPVPTPTPTSTTTPTSTMPNVSSTNIMIDDTWSTHSNRALGFEFKYPNKGSYAPQWEVMFKKEGDRGMRAGCFESMEMTQRDPEEQVALGGASFCHANYVDAGAGNAYLTDYYATSKDGQYIVVSFTKRVVSSGAMNCNFANEYPYSISSTACVPFKPEEYRNMLQTIMGTFRYVNP